MQKDALVHGSHEERLRRWFGRKVKLGQRDASQMCRFWLAWEEGQMHGKREPSVPSQPLHPGEEGEEGAQQAPTNREWLRQQLAWWADRCGLCEAAGGGQSGHSV